MTDLKPAILLALQNDAALISLLGGQHIYQLMAPLATEFPRIVFWEYDRIFDWTVWSDSRSSLDR